MWHLAVFLGLLAVDAGEVSQTIKAGVGAQGWCQGFDKAPDSSLGTPTSAKDCFTKCKTSHSDTVAVDFWDINDPHRNADNICWCQDSCKCLAPSKLGGDGTLYMADGVAPASCGYDFHLIEENNAEQGWCDGNGAVAKGTVTNPHECFKECQSQTGGAVAADYFVRSGKKVCFCEDKCPCLKASKVGGGDGVLIISDADPVTTNTCDATKEAESETERLFSLVQDDVAAKPVNGNIVWYGGGSCLMITGIALVGVAIRQLQKSRGERVVELSSFE